MVNFNSGRVHFQTALFNTTLGNTYHTCLTTQWWSHLEQLNNRYSYAKKKTPTERKRYNRLIP